MKVVALGNLKHFFSVGQFSVFKKGEIIIDPKKKLRDVFYIKEGFVIAYSREFDEEKLQSIYKKGEIFSLLWAIKGINKNFYFRAMGDVKIYRIQRSKFLKFVKSDIKIAFEVMGKILDLFEVNMERVDNLAVNKSYPKTISRLLFFVKRFGQKSSKSTEITISVPLTHAAIASSLGLSRETINRELNLLQKKGLIDFQNHQIIVINEKRLREELASFYDFQS